MNATFRRAANVTVFKAETIVFLFYLILMWRAAGIEPEVLAEEYTSAASIQALSDIEALRDGHMQTYYLMEPGEILTISTERAIVGIYLEFYSESAAWSVTTAAGSQHFGEYGFLHEYAQLREADVKELKIIFPDGAKISELRLFGAGALPADVQVWNPPYERADALLFTTHSDDEHLFFAGVLPWMAAQDYDCQVAYFCSHAQKPLRLHEQLNGLWAAGVTHYPVLGVYPDYYSQSIERAVAQLAADGYTEEDFIGYQVELLRRFKPYVVIGHDPAGEYGHGAHMLNVYALQKAIEVSGDGEAYPQSARLYGAWDVPKTYLHLWKERQIIMNFDLPLEYFGGKTAYEMSVAGYMCHTSQHWTWFTEWLVGTKTKPLTSAAQIEYYSPCQYGLYRTTVGDDVLKNDFFEHILFKAEPTGFPGSVIIYGESPEAQIIAEVSENFSIQEDKDAVILDNEVSEEEHQSSVDRSYIWMAVLLTAVCGGCFVILWKMRRNSD